MNLVPLRRALLLAALCGCASAPAPIDPDDFAPVPDDHPESAARLRGSRATAAPTAAPIAPPQSSPWRRLYRRWVRLTGERCNGLDDDGDGEIDEVYRDADGDGLANCVDTELCDGVDNDGDGDRDEGFDVDGDGRADCEVPCGGPGVALSPVNVCADGLLGPDEACDDGNTDWGDGCSPACETEGCTLSQGYWKTHSANQPPPRRDPWPLPESTPLCGTTWEMILSTPVAGRPFVVLAHQYIAARLNVAGGATAPAEVADGLRAAEVIFADCDVDPTERPAATLLVPLLTDFNEGNLGPGHCDNTCGDGRVGPGEQCDDGNTFSDDGCSAACVIDVDTCVHLEICDGLDNDQDGLRDEDFDADADGIADCFDVELCDGRDNDGDRGVDEGFDADGDGTADCFDLELCDGLDNDGDGQIDDGFDADADGVADCFDAETCDGRDNDGDGEIDEGAGDVDWDGVPDCLDTETCDGVDNTGDGRADEGLSDVDGDGVADCVDTETCDGRDNDGDGEIDEFYPDTDRDGVKDCLDAETCDGRDNDGDGVADDGFPDADGDGIGDCVDVESCDGRDNNGDGRADEGFPDVDTDGVADCADVETCDGRDNDGDGLVDEGLPDMDADGVADCVDVEECDGRDNTGDGRIDEIFPDTDGDGFADCRDIEECDGLDNDGDGATDEGFSDGDLDGVVDCLDSETCDGVDNDGDGIADDGFPDADDDGVGDCVDVEVCDGRDNDGDGITDEGFNDKDRDRVADCVDEETCDGLDNDGDNLFDEGFDADADGIADCLEICADSLTLCSDDDGSTELDDGSPAVATWAGNPRWTSVIPGATWLWDAPFEATPETGRYVGFSRQFSLPAFTSVDATLTISADNSYAVALNGFLIGEDPGELNYFAPADIWDGGPALQPGENELYVEVHNWPQPGGDAFSNPGGLLYCLDITWSWPSDPEVCNGVDDDCDGLIDEDARDADRDGVCDGLDPEVCDGLDNDGDGLEDEGFPDRDGDGRADCVDLERCNGVDDNGDGLADEGFPDTDRDGLADCVDREIACNGADDDGNGRIDEGSRTGRLWSWSSVNAGGNPVAGAIEHTWSTYNEITGELSFESTIRHGPWRTNTLTVAINEGPNPKGHGELALAYLDATHGAPILTIYAYNGENLFSSYYDGSATPGVQAPDRIATSLGDDRFVHDLWAIDDGARMRMGFTIDTTPVNERTPAYVNAWSWTGMRFGTTMGIWYHTGVGGTTAYDPSGWLTAYMHVTQNWIDLEYAPTTWTAICEPPAPRP